MFKGTTIVCVRKNDKVAMAGDGQVTLGNQIIKAGAKKVRRLHKGTVLAGFAGSTADAMTLLERFESRLEENSGDLMRSAVSLVKEWRTDRALRRLEALMIVADSGLTLMLSGAGDILEPENNVAAIGSGSGFAQAAALAFLESSDMPPSQIARRSIEIASEICIYTDNIEEMAAHAAYVQKTLVEYGFGKTENILNEWNYMDEAWAVRDNGTMRSASFVAGMFSAMQRSPVGLGAYYDAQPAMLPAPTK